MNVYEQLIEQADKLAEEGKIEESLNLYKGAIKLDPDRSEAYYNMALVCHQEGRLDEAIANFKKSSEIYTNDASVFNNLGVLYYSKGDLQEAGKNFRQAIKIEYGHTDAIYGLGKVYQKYTESGDPKAIKQLEQYKGRIKGKIERLYGDGSVEAACNITEKLAKLYPEDAEVHNDYAVLCHELGKDNEAHLAIVRAKELDPENVDIQENHRTICNEIPSRINAPSKPNILYIDTISTPTAQCCVNGLMKAYSKVGNVRPFDYRGLAARYGVDRMNQALLQTALEFRPDIIHMGKSEIIKGSTLAKIKEKIDTFILYEYADFRWQLEDFVIDISQNSDCVLFQLTDEPLLDEYRASGVRNICGFNGLATDPGIFCPTGTEKTKDIVFLGNNWHFQPHSREYDGYPKRRELIEEALKREMDVHIYGSNWEYLLEAGYETLTIHPFVVEEDFAEACSSAKITLGVNAVNTVRMYTSWRRTMNCISCGTLHITHYVPGMEDYLENKKHLVWFESVPEAIEQIDYYLNHEEEREDIARAGREIVKAKYTWDHFVADKIERYQKTKSMKGNIVTIPPITVPAEEDDDLKNAEQSWYRNFDKIVADPMLKGKIIDVGARHGTLAFKLVERYDVTAVDIDPESVKIMKMLAEQKGIDMPIHESAIKSLPFEDESFDTIILSQVLEHVRNPGDMSELMRILKPSGTMIITTNFGFAHWDPDHCWYFLPKDVYELLRYGWFFMREQNQKYAFLKHHTVVPIEDFCRKYLSQWFEYQQYELRESRWDSLEFYIRIYKTQQTCPFPVLEGEEIWREYRTEAIAEPVVASSVVNGG